MGQVFSWEAEQDVAEEGWEGNAVRALSTTSGPNSLVRRADDLRALLSALEVQLSNHENPVDVGNAYRSLSEWTEAHQDDADLSEVLQRLEPDGMYPQWRRQALEKAYVLFYSDIARAAAKGAGDGTLESLPPPPLSYQPVEPEGVAEAVEAEGGGSIFGSFESGSRFWLLTQWVYEIKERPPRSSVMPGEEQDPNARGESMVKLREIATKGRSARYMACATDPFCNLGDMQEPEHLPRWQPEALSSDDSQRSVVLQPV